MLNKDQEKVMEAFQDFLFNNSEDEFLIDAPAGYGKSYLVKYLSSTTFDEYVRGIEAVGATPEYKEVYLTATTNKAADSLTVATGIRATTIQSLLGLTVSADYKTGETKLSPTKKTRIVSNAIIFIDECSMLDSESYKYIRELTHKCKLVYIGDKYQLCPVKSGLSPVYKKGLVEHTLTIPMRNKNHTELVNLCNQLKKTVETGEFKNIKLTPGVIDFCDNTQMAKEYDLFVNDPDKVRQLTYTNKRAILYNNYIKNIRGETEVFNEGEYMISNQVCMLGNRTVHVEDEIYIEKIYARHIKAKVFNVETSIPILFTDALIRHKGDSIRVKIPESQDQMKALIKYFAKQKDWINYFAAKEGFLDIRPRDAGTIHKSQGSTLDTVFIDLADLSTCNIPSTVARLLYVAVSRATNRVVFHGELKDKYGKLIS